MLNLSWLACGLLLVGQLDVPATKLTQLTPTAREEMALERTPGQTRAVILIQGLFPHPFSQERIAQAHFQSWQRPGSSLVEALDDHADVYAFAYAQNKSLEEIADRCQLVERVRRLRQLGYDDIVLVGHSAGGLLARHLVEDHPNAGVTKVIQVCAPNGGSGWGHFTAGVRKDQEAFVASLTHQGRQQCLKCRAGKRVPPGVEFVCVIGHLVVQTKIEIGIVQTAGLDQRGDGVVASECQWTQDLRAQGIPAVIVRTDHRSAVHGKESAEVIARLLRDKQPRWDAAKIELETLRILGEMAATPQRPLANP
jgi:hypothetical protein